MNNTIERLRKQTNNLPHIKDKADFALERMSPEDTRLARQAMNKAEQWLLIFSQIMDKYLQPEDRKRMIGIDIRRDADRLARLYGGDICQ